MFFPLAAVHTAVAVHIAYMYGTTVMTVHFDMVMALFHFVYFHLFVAMMLVFDHSVYLHTAMVHMCYGYGCFGLGRKHAHQGDCYNG